MGVCAAVPSAWTQRPSGRPRRRRPKKLRDCVAAADGASHLLALELGVALRVRAFAEVVEQPRANAHVTTARGSPSPLPRVNLQRPLRTSKQGRHSHSHSTPRGVSCGVCTSVRQAQVAQSVPFSLPSPWYALRGSLLPARCRPGRSLCATVSCFLPLLLETRSHAGGLGWRRGALERLHRA